MANYEMMKEFLAIARALSDEGRLRILLALREKELYVCQIVELLGLAPSTVSKHMSILRGAGLVTFRKDGRWIYYTLPKQGASPMVRQALAWLFQSVGNSRRTEEDQQRLEAILAMDRETLCRLVTGKGRSTQS